MKFFWRVQLFLVLYLYCIFISKFLGNLREMIHFSPPKLCRLLKLVYFKLLVRLLDYKFIRIIKNCRIRKNKFDY